MSESENHTSSLLYFSAAECSVCRSLRPATEDMIVREYPLMKFVYVDIRKEPELAARHSVFSVPTVICLFENREFFRKSRVFGIRELADAISRPYEVLYGKFQEKSGE